MEYGFYGEKWNNLPSYQEREKDGYLYFYAETPGFSVFSVVGDEIGETSEQTPATGSIPVEEAEPAEEETPDTPGFTALAGIMVVSVAYLVSRKYKQG